MPPKGGRVAKLQNQIVQIVDIENSLVTLIDDRDKKFATSNLQFDQQFRQEIQTELIESGQPAEWDARPTKRDVFRIRINSDLGPGEWLLTVDMSTAPQPDFEQTSQALASAEDRYDRELDAEIQRWSS